MINVIKTYPEPLSLLVEKAKPASENYRGQDVLDLLFSDFNNKCYVSIV